MISDDEHLVLVGMMGVGKSTVGRIIAARLHRPLLDTDEMVEARTGRSVREIFESDGEPAFRAIEADVVSEALASTNPAVIAAAGGVVLSGGNRLAMREARARVVWLSAAPSVLVERVRGAEHRPLLDTDPQAALQRVLDARASLYRDVADAIVYVDGRSPSDVADAVLR
jgi:shikimate kinase